jgi:hypothetical protein
MIPGPRGAEFATPPFTSADAPPPGGRRTEEMYP